MTSSGRCRALVIGILIALALPKRVDHRAGICTSYKVEPWGAYLVETAVGREFGIAYLRGKDCV